jgi:hypothetical protein
MDDRPANGGLGGGTNKRSIAFAFEQSGRPSDVRQNKEGGDASPCRKPIEDGRREVEERSNRSANLVNIQLAQLASGRLYRLCRWRGRREPL